MMSKFSVIIPVFNEGKYIATLLDQILQLFAPLKSIEYELIVIDDGSTDNTPDILRAYSIEVITHPQNRGYGASLKEGIKVAKYNNLMILDADGTYPPYELIRILKNRTSAPLIIGTRANYFSLIRHFANKMLALLTSLLFCRWITDLNSGMRFFNKTLVQELDYESWPDGFSFTTTMTLATIIHNYPLTTIRIRCAPRHGESKSHFLPLGINIIKIILYFFRRRYRF